MNHTIPGVNAGYIDRSKLLSDHLRQQQEMISRKIVVALRGRLSKTEAAAWPLVPARAVLIDILRDADTAADIRAKLSRLWQRSADGDAAVPRLASHSDKLSPTVDAIPLHIRQD